MQNPLTLTIFLRYRIESLELLSQNPPTWTQIMKYVQRKINTSSGKIFYHTENNPKSQNKLHKIYRS